VEVGHLPDGMDAGIGSSAGVEADARLAGEARNGFLQGLLDGAQTGLRLPAVEAGAS